ncbi:PP2C family protein-serine/threonine phosphatase [Streptomyces sp. NPDC006739]|uniref:PP2C family protein-serine/threonine phosphatase n=1 Tax=Streptomyces sp. NPDC006739 TaxID=3364763 RepID=UPI00369490D4
MACPCHVRRPGPTRKGTALRNDARGLPHDLSTDPAPVVPPSRRPLCPSADVIGSELDLPLTGSHVVHALAPAFCDAASVYLLERWLREENGPVSWDPPQIEARRLAVRVGTDGAQVWEPLLPLGEVVVFPRETPYARALTTRRSQRLDAMDTHTRERLGSLAPDADGHIGDLLSSVSLLVVPLRLRDVPVGFIACTRGPERAPFTAEDTVAVERLAARACVALDNARRYERERRTALAIRGSLQPTAAPEFPGCRVAHGSLPAGDGDIIGGDWFDVLPRPGGRISLVVGDAMGHGPEAAVAMIQLRTAVRALAGLDIPPADVMRRLDALACDTPGASFATCVYAEWDAARQTCTLVGAGHPPPLIRGLDGRSTPVTLASAGLPLGLGTGSYEATVLEVPEPALLVLYSDGLVESRQTDIDQGIARLAHALDSATDTVTPGQDALHALCRRLLYAPGPPAGRDDRTLLIAALRPASGRARS